MKKIDLHIHTISATYESKFEFSLTKLKDYVEKQSLDCIAITNHNIFEQEQFEDICEALEIDVLPGIEINLEKGHILLISENTELEDFKNKCDKVTRQISNAKEFISCEQLKEFFKDLSKYLLIPHYDKQPNIRPEIISELNEFITAGEVTSPKKFNYCLKSASELVPVYFSDIRISEDINNFPPRQTYIDAENISLSSIKTCFFDKTKVFLSASDGHRFFQVFDDGQRLSSGLNVILGERSSGKTYTLKRIFDSYENVKYIKQFELLETDEENDIKKFNELLTTQQSTVSEEYLREFRTVVEDIVKIDRAKNEKEIEIYVDSLLKVAAEEEQRDIYSQCVLYNESRFLISNNESIKSLIDATRLLIENTEYSEIINKHISKFDLTSLIIDLMNKYTEQEGENLKKLWINSLISNIKSELQSSSSLNSIEEINLYRFLIEKKKLDKFQTIVASIKVAKTIQERDVRNFMIVASTRPYTSALELLTKSGIKTKFSDAFNEYNKPIKFMEELKNIERLAETEYYKYFVKIDYKILNEYGAEVSGGERSEFNLLDKIQNAHHFDLLLIDEPESSFDNLFLKNEVNELIKEIAKSVPTVIVTHNNTVGASIKADYVLYTKREIVERKPAYKIFSGNPGDKVLKTTSGEEIDNYNITLNCLEAGIPAYNERGQSYEILKN